MKLRFSQDVWVLIVLFGFMVAIGFVATGKQNSDQGIEFIPHRTTYSSKPSGVKALYDTLDKLGYRVVRHLSPLTVPPDDGVLFILTPKVSISASEWAALRTWVERGNLLIMASGLEMLDRTDQDDEWSVPSEPCAPSFLSPDVESFRVPASAGIFERTWDFKQGGSFDPPVG